jgi:hypothetical protein
MKKLRIAFLVAAFLVVFGWPFILLLSGCTVRTGPVVPPQPHGGTCETAYENAKKLGGCGLHLDTLVQDCHDEEDRSGVPMPHDCVTEATSCEILLSCT